MTSPARVDLAAARGLVLNGLAPVPAESVPLADAAGRIVAHPIRALDDLVPFARSGMDGYAVRADDTTGAVAGALVLPVVGTAFAGEAPAPLQPGTAAAIATGGALPPGADAVVPFEEVDDRGATIVVRAPVAAGAHVFLPGDDARRGEVVLEPGRVVTPGIAALLAAAGHAVVPVHRRPWVTIVSTGDELVPVDERPAFGQIRDSNATLLAACVRRDGGEVERCVRVRDAFEPLRDALLRALDDSDLIVTTGGASTGERDYAKRAVRAAGGTFAFESVALRPARPSAFARRGAAAIAVLPGNPAAAHVAYAALVRAALLRLGGRTDVAAPHVAAVLDGTLRGKADRHFLVFGRLSHDGTRFRVRPLPNQCSSLVRTSADADALIVVPPGAGLLATGAEVGVDVLDWTGVAFSGSPRA
ncbi:MAG TPA: gephyrin-like molybdotransferase Glp [Candidatus Sulfotelmatobacter sp.]|nr:gephyrin-like molybdotransferase Glp [Candidatus Sulfotelmatobacter sp.]